MAKHTWPMVSLTAQQLNARNITDDLMFCLESLSLHQSVLRQVFTKREYTTRKLNFE